MIIQSKPKPMYVQKGTYRHYKTGQFYEVVGVALHTETEQQLVIYRPLYENCQYELFARPADMFIEIVEVGGAKVPRFELV